MLARKNPPKLGRVQYSPEDKPIFLNKLTKGRKGIYTIDKMLVAAAGRSLPQIPSSTSDSPSQDMNNVGKVQCKCLSIFKIYSPYSI